MNAELAAIEELGGESRNNFKARAAKAQRKALQEQQKGVRWREFRVVEKKQQTPRVMSFILEATQPLPEEDGVDLDPGSHAKVKLGNGLVRAYSIVDGNKNRFQLGIALEEGGKGGSKYMHTQVEVGHVVEVGATTAAVPIASAASHHVFVAAGIGLTAFLRLVEVYKSINYSATLHYAARSQDEIPFKERVDALGKEYVVIYDKTAGQRLEVGELVKTRPWNSQLYFCGPRRLMDEAATAVKTHGVPQTEVHFEAFETDISGDPFQVIVANREGYGDGKVLEVGEEQTLLEILQKEFGEDDIPSSCSVGNCGTCKISLKSGRVDHRGTALTDEDKATSMLSCVSRGVGRIAIEI
ncbi:putative dioxygenase [Diplogelasinospora grovesii]|uniref:Dioxygenase n=1 Tax=Diplogelasinospora grovesii TaxID=303347 RepID=A0AAN6NHM9_9PEZI|nr:putative dioxygenase [Diplogelasinospora grovesii]